MRKRRTRLRGLYLLALALFSQASPESVAAAYALILPFALLHFAASGYLAKSQFVVTAGPYRFMRNPFYVANFFLDAGFAVAAGGLNLSIPLGIAIVYFFYFYGRVIPDRVRREEEKLLGLFGETYARYCREVPRFFPNLFSSVGPRGRFRLENLRANGEVPRVITYALIPLWLYLFSSVRERGAGSLQQPHLVGLAAGLGAAFLLTMLLDRVARSDA